TSILLCFGNRHNHITVFDETIFVSSMTLYQQAMQTYIHLLILRSKILVGKSRTLFDLHRSDAGCAFLQNAFSALHILRRNRDDVNVTAPAAKPLEIPNFRFATLADKIHHWVALSGVDRPAADFFYSAHAAFPPMNGIAP
ncbi:MAG: hypothetical protein KH119_03215, partial [Faecalibacterium prausnitzii]|nr:hypothetical protein [Faecalibacterium prausnitzii]